MAAAFVRIEVVVDTLVTLEHVSNGQARLGESCTLAHDIRWSRCTPLTVLAAAWRVEEEVP